MASKASFKELKNYVEWKAKVFFIFFYTFFLFYKYLFFKKLFLKKKKKNLKQSKIIKLKIHFNYDCSNDKLIFIKTIKIIRLSLFKEWENLKF